MKNSAILNWNVRGLNTPARREAVRDMIQVVQPMILCLQETKLAEINPQIAREIIGTRLDSYQILPAEGTRGGILLGWQSDFINASNLVLKEFSLTMQIKLRWMDASFRMTTV
jgi:hypothetical protein